MPTFKNQMQVKHEFSVSPLSGVQPWKSFCYLALVLDWKVLFGTKLLGELKYFSSAIYNY